ncbi:MAG: hypothetical protein OXG21_06520 [Rhodobacteraceae bacterium]|nr:hypothetical protein [Paracoccaceae bacterium]MDE2739607.1 hypothetical protein [Paracoccaceae bacterium]
MAVMLVGCSEPTPQNKSIRDHLCDEKQGSQIKKGPQVKQTGTAKLGINSDGEIIRSVEINFETTTKLGRDDFMPSSNTLAPCDNDN